MVSSIPSASTAIPDITPTSQWYFPKPMREIMESRLRTIKGVVSLSVSMLFIRNIFDFLSWVRRF